jgi:hypothetical protein
MSEIRRVIGSPAPVVMASFPQNSNDCISEGFYHEINFNTYGKLYVFSRYIISRNKNFCTHHPLQILNCHHPEFLNENAFCDYIISI